MATVPVKVSYSDNKTALLFSDHSVPIIAIDFAFPMGSAFDPAGKHGLANLTSAMLTEGVDGYDALSYKKELESHAVQLSFSANRDFLTGRVQFLSNQTNDAVRLTRLSLLSPMINPDDLKRIKRQQNSYFDYKEQTPKLLAQDLWWQTAFSGHPYSHPVDGTRESIAGINVKDIKSFLQSCISLNNLTVGIAGDANEKQAQLILNDLFNGLQPVGNCPAMQPFGKIVGQTVHLTKNLPQSVAYFGHSSIKRSDPDFYSMMVVDYILGSGSFSSRLMDEVREKRGLTYGIGTNLSDTLTGPLILGQVASAADKIEQALSLTKTIWQDVAKNGITQQELNDAKTYLNGSFPLQQDNTKSLSALMLYMQQQNLPIDYLDKRAELINTVTLNQANSMAKRILHADNLVIAVVGSDEHSKK